MAFFDSSYIRRKAFSIVTTGSASSADVTLTIPEGWDSFWDAIDSSGDGIRVTQADGLTPITYQWSSFTKATKTGVLELDGASTPPSSGRCVLLWLYYAPTDTPTDGSGSFTASSPLTASMDMSSPPGESVYPVLPQIPGARQPRHRIAKSSNETMDLYLDFGDILQRADGLYNGRSQYEEVAVAQVGVLDSGGSAVGAMSDDAAMRWVSTVQGGRERVYLKLRVQAGTTNNRYTLAGQYLTATPDSTPTYRTLETRIGIDVYDQLES